jgi:class 3 adenylate cyclase/pimeloyl-ACP methyl ester carboxylesterase
VSAVPETRYVTKDDGTQVAYQVVGEGPLDLIYSAGGAIPIDLVWDAPPAARFLNRLASFARLVLFDPSGWGASSGTPGLPAVEDFSDDLMRLIDTLGLVRPAVIAWSEGAIITFYSLAANPEAFSALVLINAYARYLRDTDYPHGMPADAFERSKELTAALWGTGHGLRLSAPDVADDEAIRRWLARCERLAGAPRELLAVMNDLLRRDLRSVLPSIRLPTLVLHRRDNGYIRVGHGRYLAEQIPGATFVELAGSDHFPFAFTAASTDPLDHIETFLTGHLNPVEDDRVLATVVFTDIVESTQQAVALGDRGWRDLLARYDALARQATERFRGKPVKSTGDGILATFDGPARAVRCSQSIGQGARQLGLEIRTGVHTGEIELRGDDIAGIAVHIAARICQHARSGEVLVSRTVTDLVAGAGLAFEDRGDQELKGVPGRMPLFALLE